MKGIYPDIKTHFRIQSPYFSTKRSASLALIHMHYGMIHREQEREEV